MNTYFEAADERGLVAGACGFYADAFGGVEGCREARVDLLGGADEHAPSAGELVNDGFELLIVG